MKITYNKNPLNSTIELDSNEQKELWYKIKIKEMEELLYDAHFYLTDEKYFNLEDAKKSVHCDYYCKDEKSPLDKRCDLLLECYLAELKSNHWGDCTCSPSSCMKCIAEEFLGISTADAKKHVLHTINSAFGKNNEKTIEEAIDSLANDKITKGEAWSTEQYEKHLPRWTEESTCS